MATAVHHCEITWLAPLGRGLLAAVTGSGSAPPPGLAQSGAALGMGVDRSTAKLDQLRWM